VDHYEWTIEDERALAEYEKDLWWGGFGWGVALTVIFIAIFWNFGGRQC